MTSINHSNNLCLSKLDALKKVKELCENYKNLNNPSNDPKNLLDNLCSGLETFLGFNSDSKGYDGSGIVYSDLDRLCDAVMGFLSGVLGAVKDENEVTTYDNYITGDENKLNKVLDTLTKQIGSGCKGLAVSVAEVKAWLEGYEKSVNDKTENVKMQLTTLINEKIDKEYHDVVERNKRKNLQTQLQGWTQVVHRIHKYVESVEGHDVIKLNANLREQINKEIKIINKSVKMLVDSAENTMIIEQVSSVDSELERQKNELNETVKRESERIKNSLTKHEKNVLRTINFGFSKLQNKLTEEFGNILDGLGCVTKSKNKQFDEIIKSLEKAKQSIDFKVNHVGVKYEMPVNAMLGDIKRLLNQLEKKSDANSQLWQDVNSLTTKVANLEQVYKQELYEIRKVVDAAVDHLPQVDTAVKEGLRKMRDDIVTTAIGRVMAKLNTAQYEAAANADGGVVSIAKLLTLNGTQLKTWLTEAGGNNLQYVKNTTGMSLDQSAATVPRKAVLFSLENLKSARHKRGNTNKSMFSAIEEDIVSEVKGAFTAAADGTISIQSLMESYHTEMNTKLTETFRKKIDAMTTKLADLINVEPGTSGFTVNTNRIKGYRIDDTKGVQAVLENTIKDTLRKIETLQDVPTDVQSKNEQVKGLMDHLKAELITIQSEVYMIMQSVTAADDAISKLIDSVYDAVQKAKNTATRSIEALKIALTDAAENAFNKTRDSVAELQTKVSEEIANAFKIINTQVRSLFATQKHTDLCALKKLIDAQKSEIERIVEIDSSSGLKGLFGRMNILKPMLNTITQNECKEAAKTAKGYIDSICDYISTEVPTPSSHKVADLQARTYDLLTHLHDNKRTFTFDSEFRSHLHGLTSALSTFDPATFANPHHPQLLDALKAGMHGLVKEMEKAYVNRYCGKTITWSETPGADFKATVDAKRCAKVFMSCLPMLLNDLSKVKERCGHKGEWSKKNVYYYEDAVKGKKVHENPLGVFLSNCGFKVAKNKYSKDGELRCKHDWDGGKMLNKVLEKTFSNPDQIKHIKDCKSNKDIRTDALLKHDKFEIFDILQCLFLHLNEFYRTCHLSTFSASKHPASIHDMLLWMSGLPHSPVYNALSNDGFSDLFEKKDEDENIDAPISVSINEDPDCLEAYPNKITATGLALILTDVCHHAEETLISFLGHGHSGGTYACEFNTNSAKLTYPSDPSKCLDLLFEVIGRVYNQLFFLFKQCSYSTKLGGWYDCWYGQGVGGSTWNCNTIQCPGQRGEQTHNQTCDQKCNQDATCGLKSPLQSFLEDGLPGFLPHPYTKSNCKPTCTAPGHFGKVCITPMGFNDISGMASRRQQGRHIMDVLHEFCGSEHAPLSRLCGLLTCLLTRPPQTLGDMFAFYYNFFNGWYDPKNSPRFTHREAAFGIEVKKAHFEAPYDDPDGNSIFTRGHGIRHVPSDWFSLLCGDHSSPDCGRYLQPIGQNIWTVFSNNCADKYLSWVVYLTETFYDLLKMLYEDCNTNCGKETSKCNRTSCISSCPLKSEIKSATQSKSPSEAKYHSTDCKSIVTCKSTLPTFCKYGFVFDSPETLSGMHGDYKKKTCKEFCTALDNVLNEETQFERILAKLKYKTIPNFLFAIRAPFIWLNVALWLLSVLYLLHIMIIRLDLLHIKSHLHSPSSHRIAAQSLLAAARVNKLNRVFYLQP